MQGRSSWPRRSWWCRAASSARTITPPPQRILQTIHDAALDRHSYVGAIGGGAVLDVVGYAAAMAHRGIRLIRFPPPCWRKTIRRSA